MLKLTGHNYLSLLLSYALPSNLHAALQDWNYHNIAWDARSSGNAPDRVTNPFFRSLLTQAGFTVRLDDTERRHYDTSPGTAVLFYTGGIESIVTALLADDPCDLVHIDPRALAGLPRVEIPLMILGAAMGYRRVYLGIEAADTTVPIQGLDVWGYTRDCWREWHAYSGVPVDSRVYDLGRDALTQIVLDHGMYHRVNSCDHSTMDQPSWCGHCFKCGLQWLTHGLLNVRQDDPRVPAQFAAMEPEAFLPLVRADLDEYANGRDPFLNMGYVARAYANYLTTR